MSKLLRGFYRIFIKNRFIRWVWMLALAIWGVRVATERGLAWQKAPLSKTVMAIPSSTISSFTIRRNEDDEITFSQEDTCWLVVKNNITLRLPTDSMKTFLSVFEKMDRIELKTLAQEDLTLLNKHFHFDILMTKKNNTTLSFSVYYNDRDSISQEPFTYIKLPNDNTLQGIKGDLIAAFDKNFDNYRDKTLLNIPRDSIVSLIFKSPFESLSFYRRDSSWLFSNKQVYVLQNPFRQYISNLLILRGVKFYEGDRDILSESKIQNQLVVHLPSDSIILTNYQLEKYHVLHSTQNNDAFFQIDSTNNIFPNLSIFLK